MKNEKVVKVCQVVIQVCNIANIIAQTLISAFGTTTKKVVNSSGFTEEEIKMIKEFQEQGVK